MREGSLEAPTRHAIDWRDAGYTDPEKIDAELRRVFDICHGCRRCFNLCDSFPRLFDLIDEAPTGELDSVDSAGFQPVIDACTLCDMCFMTKCPYVPPHAFNLDFPHLILRARAAALARGAVPWRDKALAATDRNGRLAGPVAPLVNFATRRGNGLTRPLMEKVVGVDRNAELPKYHARSFARIAAREPAAPNPEAPAHGRKAVLYSTCFVNYNNPDIGRAARAVLAHNGVATRVLYPRCCGMPQLEHGDIAHVAESAAAVAAEMRPLIDEGHDVIALVPSCALMLKFEWPLILPEDDNVRALSQASFDISEYVVDIARKEGLAPGLGRLEGGGVSLHMACHARAQNMGQKAAEMLRLIPEIDLAVIERCSGHGGSWGVKKDFFEIAIKIGKPVARQALGNEKPQLASECPLAGVHILQGMARLDGETVPARAPHPIELFARAYGLEAAS